VQQLLPVLCKAAASSSRLRRRRASVGALSAYAATKGAIDTLVKHFASGAGARGIRVNAVAPAWWKTDMSNFTKTEGRREVVLGMQALKRRGPAGRHRAGGGLSRLRRWPLDHR